MGLPCRVLPYHIRAGDEKGPQGSLRARNRDLIREWEVKFGLRGDPIILEFKRWRWKGRTIRQTITFRDLQHHDSRVCTSPHSSRCSTLVLMIMDHSTHPFFCLNYTKYVLHVVSSGRKLIFLPEEEDGYLISSSLAHTSSRSGVITSKDLVPAIKNPGNARFCW
ncbi:hypothetical protein TNIN_92641 [Trichonephila inaurata madagascariensis]|uniref:Uncharacterized protein n=1 Tax=Trichonephila inaurata madagascariensis TaxID=2747483 RepID=A0A8X6XXV5_9ARAC|nr:hypothetical protein TNIN_92641 [Trichonephila inaurata madagascariensis]